MTPPLKIVFVGHVDHGKSTLIGRILADTDSLPEGKIASIRAACAARGEPFEYAFVLDAFSEEQEQNITLDTTQIHFRSTRRDYVIIDVPGHRDLVKNMIAGAADADAAVLVIAADEGVQEQSRRHGQLLSLLNLRQIVVAVNKMDLADYREERFRQIEREYTAFLQEVGITASVFIPVSARAGENVIADSANAMPWFKGNIIRALDAFTPPKSANNLPLRFPIQDIYRLENRRVFAGRVESGTLKVGDEVIFFPHHKTTRVATIERWGEPFTDVARVGESVGITLSDQIFIERGHVAAHEADAPIVSNRVQAKVFWLGREPLRVGALYRLRIASQDVECEVIALRHVVNASTLETVVGRCDLHANEIAEVTFHTRAPLVFDNHDRVPGLGRLVLVDGRDLVGGGVISGAAYPSRSQIKSGNIFWNEGKITAGVRSARHGHRSAVIWLTGLSGSGKSTIARALEKELFHRSINTYVLDGDNLRHGLNSNLGFAAADRAENIRRVSEVAMLMADAGVVVITSLISPYRADRIRAREISAQAGTEFIEVFVDAPLAVCEERDPKGLYRKARAGELKGFTGIDAPYEAPENAELILRTNDETVPASVARILENVLPRLRLAISDTALQPAEATSR